MTTILAGLGFFGAVLLFIFKALLTGIGLGLGFQIANLIWNKLNQEYIIKKNEKEAKESQGYNPFLRPAFS